MATREVPRTDWKAALAAVCDRAITRPVTVEVQGADLGNQRLVTFMPLIGLEVARHGLGPETIEITTTPSNEGLEEVPFTHVIANPTHVWVEEDATGQVQALDIEAGDATTTVVRFEPNGD